MDLNDFNPADDLSSAEEKIKKYTGEVGWKYLAPHFKAGSLIYVDSDLSIIEAATAFSRDEKGKVEQWLKTGLIVKPCSLHAQHWETSEASFRATIVRPFVLIQPLFTQSEQ